jgi:GDP-D-mannose dehydratase
VFSLRGDATKAQAHLGWSAAVSFPDLVREMVSADLVGAQKCDCIQASGLPVAGRH